METLRRLGNPNEFARRVVPSGRRAPARGPSRRQALAGADPSASPLDRMRSHRPGVPAEGPVGLSEIGFELSAVIPTGIAGPPVDPVAAPDQPVAGLDVQVLPEEQLLQEGLEASLSVRVGSDPTELTAKQNLARHRPKVSRAVKRQRGL